MDTTRIVPIIAPDELEIEALSIVAAFLHTARQQLVELIQGDELGYHHAVMLAELRDQVESAALLCEGMEALTS